MPSQQTALTLANKENDWVPVPAESYPLSSSSSSEGKYNTKKWARPSVRHSGHLMASRYQAGRRVITDKDNDCDEHVNNLINRTGAPKSILIQWEEGHAARLVGETLFKSLSSLCRHIHIIDHSSAGERFRGRLLCMIERRMRSRRASSTTTTKR